MLNAPSQGIFVALALRFDVSRGKGPQYFTSAFLGYIFGLALTIFVMNWFQAVQPALLYIVPDVIGFLVVHCIWNGDVKPVCFSLDNLEKTFHLTRADRDLLLKQEYDVQVWCVLLNDKVQFRMQWPQYADLQVNGIPVRCINRPGSQLLGANGRDDGPIMNHTMLQRWN